MNIKVALKMTWSGNAAAADLKLVIFEPLPKVFNYLDRRNNHETGRRVLAKRENAVPSGAPALKTKEIRPKRPTLTAQGLSSVRSRLRQAHKSRFFQASNGCPNLALLWLICGCRSEVYQKLHTCFIIASSLELGAI